MDMIDSCIYARIDTHYRKEIQEKAGRNKSHTYDTVINNNVKEGVSLHRTVWYVNWQKSSRKSPVFRWRRLESASYWTQEIGFMARTFFSVFSVFFISFFLFFSFFLRVATFGKGYITWNWNLKWHRFDTRTFVFCVPKCIIVSLYLTCLLK